MEDLIILCLVIGVPSLLAIDVLASVIVPHRSTEYGMASAGIFWDRPALRPRYHHLRSSPVAAEAMIFPGSYATDRARAARTGRFAADSEPRGREQKVPHLTGEPLNELDWLTTSTMREKLDAVVSTDADRRQPHVDIHPIDPDDRTEPSPGATTAQVN